MKIKNFNSKMNRSAANSNAHSSRENRELLEALRCLKRANDIKTLRLGNEWDQWP